MSSVVFDQDLLDQIERVVHPGQVIHTLGIARPNRVVSIGGQGILVDTERSSARGMGPQLVPAWMVVTAWEQLREKGVLTNRELLNDLNVKRSAFVSALLSRFDNVEIASLRPITLHFKGAPGAGRC